MALFDFLTQDIAIDLGTANTIIIHNEKVVVDQPSIVAVDRTYWQSYCCWKTSAA
jgi:rod shape-determining protein MreB